MFRMLGMVLFTITVIHYPFKKLNEIAKIKSKEQRRLWPRLRPLNRSLYRILWSSMDAGSRERFQQKVVLRSLNWFSNAQDLWLNSRLLSCENWQKFSAVVWYLKYCIVVIKAIFFTLTAQKMAVKIPHLIKTQNFFLRNLCTLPGYPVHWIFELSC